MLTPLTNSMKSPCERVVQELLPSIRSELVKELNKAGLKQAEIARRLVITRSAVNQYLKKTRGKKSLDKKMETVVRKLAKELLNKNKKFEACTICGIISGKKCGWSK
jgi:predicted transcriptional regulator